MRVFDVVVLLAALCGLIMVLGGIFLLYRGAITLAATPGVDAISVEFKRQLRIGTQAPGIAFFLVGLLFVAAAAVVSKPPAIHPLTVEGQVADVSDGSPITLLMGVRWQLPRFTTGQIRGMLYPDFSLMQLEVTAPGYSPVVTPVQVTGSMATIGTVRLRRVLDSIPASRDIAPLAFEPRSPTQATSAFGVPQ